VVAPAASPPAVATVETGSETPFLALMGLTAIILLSPQTVWPGLMPSRSALLAAVVAIGAHLVDRFSRRQPIVTPTREIRLAACLAAWAVLSVPMSYWPGGGWSLLLDLYFKTLVVFWLLSETVRTRMRLRRAAWGLALMSVPLAATGVQNYRSGSFVREGSQAVQRITGYEAPLTSNPNDLALVLNLIWPLVLALFLLSRRPITRAILLGILVLDVVAVIVTFSRSGFLTMIALAVLYLGRLLRRPGRGWVVAVAGLAILCLPLLPSGYTSHLGTITDVDADPTGSAQARRDDMKTAVRYVLAHPIVGAGPGQDILALNEMRGPRWTSVHNVYLQHAVDLGLPGLALFLLLLARCLGNARAVRRHTERRPEARDLFYLAEGLEMSLAGFAVAGLFYPVAYHVYFYYFGGLAVGARAAHAADA
jgi:probable O-glycosylation ligase (exosortase A-associated)